MYFKNLFEYKIEKIHIKMLFLLLLFQNLKIVLNAKKLQIHFQIHFTYFQIQKMVFICVLQPRKTGFGLRL